MDNIDKESCSFALTRYMLHNSLHEDPIFPYVTDSTEEVGVCSHNNVTAQDTIRQCVLCANLLFAFNTSH